MDFTSLSSIKDIKISKKGVQALEKFALSREI